MNKEFDFDQLNKLAKNPHYKMNAKEVAALEKLRNDQIVKANPKFKKHNPELEVGDEQQS